VVLRVCSAVSSAIVLACAAARLLTASDMGVTCLKKSLLW